MLSHEQLKKKMLSNPKVREEYDELENEFGIIEKLIIARVKAGLSQADVAERMGIATPSVSRLESAKHSPSLKTLVRYADAVGQRLDIRLHSVDKKEKSVRAAKSSSVEKAAYKKKRTPAPKAKKHR